MRLAYSTLTGINGLTIQLGGWTSGTTIDAPKTVSTVVKFDPSLGGDTRSTQWFMRILNNSFHLSITSNFSPYGNHVFVGYSDNSDIFGEDASDNDQGNWAASVIVFADGLTYRIRGKDSVGSFADSQAVSFISVWNQYFTTLGGKKTFADVYLGKQSTNNPWAKVTDLYAVGNNLFSGWGANITDTNTGIIYKLITMYAGQIPYFLLKKSV
jgi:hypothetical protein